MDHGHAACQAMTKSSCPAGQGFSSASASRRLTGSTDSWHGPPSRQVQSGPGASICLDMTIVLPCGQGFSSASADTDDQTGVTDDDGTCSVPSRQVWSALDLLGHDAPRPAGQGFHLPVQILTIRQATDDDARVSVPRRYKSVVDNSRCLIMDVATCEPGESRRGSLDGKVVLNDGTCLLCAAGKFKATAGRPHVSA